MANLTFSLHYGLKIGEDVLKEVVLREMTAGDILDAKEDAEKMVLAPEGPVLVTSPTRFGTELLRRQIVKIGNLSGPIALSELKRLHPADLNMIQAKADEIDIALGLELERLSKGIDGGR
ncbi:Mu-like prophage FluMu protein gp41 [Humidesulfovibrio mexicanus]|uniref:Mu-like prophage FluMu protein gp41 n=1 Tax=Humidesulfovibrio mexicanus TaxID=147047 RepID=A0A238XKK8_9BACT|nr:phage tail assembly protein [Humidesulfovibrio mexicanus]SNR59556.1 Mu-like prophage FluMu protein gp41 [Humidesulfovibrio mexicanus]